MHLRSFLRRLCQPLKPILRSLTPSHCHIASLRRPLNRSHHSLAPLHHPWVPFYRPIMHFSNLGLLPLHHPELCITVTYRCIRRPLGIFIAPKHIFGTNESLSVAR